MGWAIQSDSEHLELKYMKIRVFQLTCEPQLYALGYYWRNCSQYRNFCSSDPHNECSHSSVLTLHRPAWAGPGDIRGPVFRTIPRHGACPPPALRRLEATGRPQNTSRTSRRPPRRGRRRPRPPGRRGLGEMAPTWPTRTSSLLLAEPWVPSF